MLFSRNCRLTGDVLAHHWPLGVAVLACPESAIPVRLLDVVVLWHGKAVPAFRPAVFKYFPTGCSLHPGAEPMHSSTASDFGLVRSFRHDTFLTPNHNDSKTGG